METSADFQRIPRRYVQDYLRAVGLWFLWSDWKLKLIYDRQSVDQSVLVSGAHLGPATNFSSSLKFPLDSCGFLIL
jgi:hypothetical protein